MNIKRESWIKGQNPKENLIYVDTDGEEAKSIKKHCLYGLVGVKLSGRNRFKIIISHLVFQNRVLASFPDSRLFTCQFLLPVVARVPFMKYKSDYVSTSLENPSLGSHCKRIKTKLFCITFNVLHKLDSLLCNLIPYGSPTCTQCSSHTELYVFLQIHHALWCQFAFISLPGMTLSFSAWKTTRFSSAVSPSTWLPNQQAVLPQYPMHID